MMLYYRPLSYLMNTMSFKQSYTTRHIAQINTYYEVKGPEEESQTQRSS